MHKSKLQTQLSQLYFVTHSQHRNMHFNTLYKVIDNTNFFLFNENDLT